MPKKFGCEIKPYRLQFIREAKTSRDTMTYRDIWTVKLYDNFGRDGFGEIAPLPGLSAEFDVDRAEYEKKLVEVSENIDHYLHNKQELLNYPSILFGIETAWLSYKHRDFVFYKTPFTTEDKPLPINALVWMGDFDYMKSQVDNILKKEVSCIKLKIGGIDFGMELELLKYIRTQRDGNSLEIRLDANGAFLPDESLDKIKLLAEYQIHSLEQPIQPKQHNALHQIIKSSPIPIALDEELIGIYDYKEKCNLVASLQPHYLVLKPSLHGGLMGCEEWIFIAQTNKINWWVTSALESNIGLNAIAQWCSRYERCYEIAQGLGTGNLYENNFPTHLTVSDYLLYMQK